MKTVDTVAEELGLADSWVEQGGALWLPCDKLNPRAVAKALISSEARFITITATELPEDAGIRMDYHWDLDGQLIGLQFQASDHKIESIYDLCEAANWIEREIHEYFAVDFLGREYEPLFLRNGEKAGVNLREEEE